MMNNNSISSEEYRKQLIEKAKKQYEILKNKLENEKKSDEKHVESQNMLQKVASYGKSMVSRGLKNKKAEENTKNLRSVSCHGSSTISCCSERKQSQKFDNSFYCGACGCGDKKGTQLINLMVDGKEQYSKLDYPTVTCPLKMPGFSNYIPSEEGVSENSRKKEIEILFGIDYIEQNSK